MSRKSIVPNIRCWMTEHYGSRRGFALTWWYRARYLLGGYRGYRRVDWASVGRLVFVCKGNICRSAYAEAVARRQGVESISCGLETRPGLPANDDAVRVAATKNVNLEGHRTTPLHALDIRENDLLVAMEPWQGERLEQELGKQHACTLLGLWGGNASPHIHDPYGAPTAYFDNCFDYIEKSVHEITGKIGKTENS